MAIISCPNCGKPISDKAFKCPKCGINLQSVTSKKKKGWLVIVLVLLIAGIGFGIFTYLSTPHCGKPGEYESYTKEQLMHLAEKNDLEAITQLGRNARDAQDYDTALQFYLIAAEKGYADAQYLVGLNYAFASCEINSSVDPSVAFNWMMKAALQGHADAQYMIGIWYNNGVGVPQDPLEGDKWLKKAADQGNVQAQEKLN